jgi:outer membrane protein assembly factor BamB
VNRHTRRPFTRSAGFIVLAVVFGLSRTGAAEPPGGNWPQWRGPDRTNVSTETGLLKEWPEGGPPLLWKAEGLGEGVPSIAVAGGKIFVLGYRDDKEFLTALNEIDGKPAWSVPVGPAVKEMGMMRWLSQRTPTVDGERVYAFTARGELICLATADGKEQWRKDYVKDFGGRPGSWGYCDFPLVDGDRLICTPGANDATQVALNKKTGELIWKCPVPGCSRGTYGGVVAAEIGGVRQYVHQLEIGVIGVAASDGKLLWRYAGIAAGGGNVHTAIVKGNEVFCSCGWGVGATLLKLTPEDGAFKVEPQYQVKLPFESWLGSSVRIDGFVHASNGFSAAWATGKRVEQRVKGLPTSRMTMTSAEGRLYFRTGTNVVMLVEITEKGEYVKRGEFKNPVIGPEPTWTTPVVAGGRLYLRDLNLLFCYDLREMKPRRRGPDVIFVPTPQDVVEKMLELASVKKADLVVDLGCGDGRIVVTAAKKYGCKSIGYDIDKECVRLSLENVKKEGVEKLVRIERADMFDVDLSEITVAALYLGPDMNAKLIPQLEKMKPGSRIVSHAFEMPGVKPDKVISFTSMEDDVTRKLYLWTIPLKKDPKKD